MQRAQAVARPPEAAIGLGWLVGVLSNLCLRSKATPYPWFGGNKNRQLQLVETRTGPTAPPAAASAAAAAVEVWKWAVTRKRGKDAVLLPATGVAIPVRQDGATFDASLKCLMATGSKEKVQGAVGRFRLVAFDEAVT